MTYSISHRRKHIRNKLYLFEVLSRVREAREKALTLAIWKSSSYELQLLKQTPNLKSGRKIKSERPSNG